MLSLTGELAAIIERRWQARVIKNPDKNMGFAEFVFRCGDGRPVGEFRESWKSACKKDGMLGLLFHDLQRSAIRNFDRTGVSQPVGQMIFGHKTASVYRRYRTIPAPDIREALERTQAEMLRTKSGVLSPLLRPWKKRGYNSCPHKLQQYWAAP